MLRPLVAVTAAAVLLAGCSGGDDKKSDSPPGGDGNNASSSSSSSPTPTAPEVPSFDPPKGLTPVAAYAVPIDQETRLDDRTLTAGMVGQTTFVAGKLGVTGRHIAGQREPFYVMATDKPATITTHNHSEVMPVQLDGKDVAVIAYTQTDKGNGTQKAKSQVVIQWLDAVDGKKVAEVTVDLSAKFGPGTGAAGVSEQLIDPATGQVALGLGADGEGSRKNGSYGFTVFADPKTQKANIVPFISPAGLLNGTVVGAKGSNQENAHDGTIVVFDGASGKVSKQIPTKMNYLRPAVGGTKHAYLNGSAYVPNSKSLKYTYESGLYVVDIATGTLVGQVKSTLGTEKAFHFNCLADQASAVVCSTGENMGTDEIVGIDDTTGKKVWGYNKNSASRVVPLVTGAFHGVVYGHAQEQPVMLDAKTGADIPQPSTAPSETPSASTTPTDDGSNTSPTGEPTGTASPGDGSTASPGDGSLPGSDLSQFNPKLGTPSPTAITKYGATYLQNDKADNYDVDKILIAMKPTA
jgi:hypothetical protein